MSSEIRTVGRHTLIYGVGVVASKLVSLVMLPVYTRYLTAVDYGVLELLSTTIDVIGMIGGLGLAASLFKHYAEMDGDTERRELTSTVIIGTTGLSFLVCCLGLIASPMLTRVLFGVGQTPLYFRLFFLIYFFQSIGNLTFLLVQAEGRSGLFVGLNVAKMFLTLALTIQLLVNLHWGIRGILLANLSINAAFAVSMGIHMLRQAGFRFSREKFMRLSRFGAPLVVSILGSFVLTYSDRYFLNHYAGTAAVGVYSVAYKFSFLLTAFAVAPFSQIWEPRRFAIARLPDAAEIYRRMFVYLNVSLFLGSIAILIFVKDLLTVLVAPAFLPAYRVVPLLLITTIIQQWTGYCNLGLFITNSTKLFAVSAIIAIVADLLLNLLLIPPYGMLGAAWATAAAYALRFGIVYVLAQKRYHIVYPWPKAAELAGLFGVVWAARHLADHLPLGISLGISALLAALASGFIYLRMLDRDEKAFIKGIIRRRFFVSTVQAT